jgi:phosphotransacetylase
MFDIEACFDQQILQTRRERPTVVFPESLDVRVIEAVCYLTRFVRPVFLAPQNEVAAIAARAQENLDRDRLAYAFSECAFVDINERKDLVVDYADMLIKRLGALGEDIDEKEALHRASHPAWFAILSVLAGHADSVVGGAVYGPIAYFRPMLKLLKDREVATEAGILVLPDDHSMALFPENILVLGDAGVNADMDAMKLAEVAMGTCVVARDLVPESVLPSICGAMVSYSHRGMDEGHGAEIVRQATELLPKIIEQRVKKNER